jgi:hypothetical protein
LTDDVDFKVRHVGVQAATREIASATDSRAASIVVIGFRLRDIVDGRSRHASMEPPVYHRGSCDVAGYLVGAVVGD